jgi:phosphate:Na+ symporter
MSAALVLDVLGGLVLFLFGVLQLATGVEALAGDRARTWLARWTAHPLTGVATGAVATTVLDSSSVTIILVIALVNAGLLSFTQSLGVIMGANIGTTISSQIFALEAEAYAPVVMTIGFGLLVVGRHSARWRSVGLSVLGLGLVFFGLRFMGDAVAPLRNDPSVLAWMTGLERPLVGAAVGMIMTVVLQSSSAMLGIVITLAGQELITLPAALAVMLGAEIGTCADTLVASLGRSVAAVRAGLFHLSFNVTTAALGLLLLHPLGIAAGMLPGGDQLPRQIANAHVLFNVTGVLLFLPFTSAIAAILHRALPDRTEERKSLDLADQDGPAGATQAT